MIIDHSKIDRMACFELSLIFLVLEDVLRPGSVVTNLTTLNLFALVQSRVHQFAETQVRGSKKLTKNLAKSDFSSTALG